MTIHHARLAISWVLALGVIAAPALADAPKKPIKFNRDIRPILSDNCFVCHGPDNNLRKGKLRLDDAKDAFADRGGYKVLVPGKPRESELFLRITSDFRTEVMPPPNSKKQLSKEQIALIRDWINQGAKYEKHWSLIPPTRSDLPKVMTSKWPRNAIDRFVLARLEKEGLQPSPEASKRVLVRRLYFDLLGLPPTEKEVDMFVNSKDPKAYEKLVDHLFASPHFGERMAMYWLDLVRFADTGGYHSDNHRDLYLYRDYVIKAFNKNLKYDRFVTEQLAGDLLPTPTRDQKIASGYNRLLQTTEEGGAQAKEYQAKYYADRVRNLGEVFLGLTLGCAECHDHKFDPITTKEFYQIEAFFADINERSVGRQPQTSLPTPSQAKELATLDQQISSLQKRMKEYGVQFDGAVAEWETALTTQEIRRLPRDIQNVLRIDPNKRNANHRRSLHQWLSKRPATLVGYVDESGRGLASAMAKLQSQRAKLVKQIPTSLVTVAMTPRPIRVLPRGNWLDDSGPVVLPSVPDALPSLSSTKEKRLSRLDLAKWMFKKDNPLVGRVFVNRLWMLYFGEGLAKTLDDLGSQGAWPTHPELLDWLAIEFRDSGWDMQHMIKLMVTSSTYRQRSKATEKLRAIDPYNKLLARQGRWRLEAEMVRDNALAVSSLLQRKIGGPSVKPYQPAGYWQHLNFPRRTYKKSDGVNQYRRGLYTYWQRTFLHPSLMAFDATSREECTVQRPRSNTPQQALVLLNDPTYVEAARAFAEKIVAGAKDTPSRVRFAYRRALNREPRPVEIKLLSALFDKHLGEYEKDVKAAQRLLNVGDRPIPTDKQAPELAAWTSVARVILNLHETITRQ